jgi:TP901 family phage tail tape measure protein
MAFNLVAEVVLSGPSNVKNVIGRIQNQLKGIQVPVNLKMGGKEVQKLKTLQKHLDKVNASVQTIGASASTATSALGSMGASAKTYAAATAAASRATTKTHSTLKKSTKAVRDSANAMEAFGKSSALAIRRYSAFVAATAVTFGFVRAVTSAVGEAIKFDRELVRLAQVTKLSTSALTPLVNEVTRLSTTLGVSSSELIGVSRILAQAGLSATDTRIALEVLAKSTLAPTFSDINRTAEGAIAAMRQFKIEANELEAALGSINAVSAQLAVESDDIITAIRKAGGVFAAASHGIGQPLEQLQQFIAVFTSIRATTRESADTIGTALRTIFPRLQRSATVELLKEHGVELRNAKDEFIGAYNAIDLIGKKLGTLSPLSKVFQDIVEQLGGLRQIGKVIPAIRETETRVRALKAAQEGQNSLARDAAVAQQAMAVQITKVKEEFTALVREMVRSGAFKAMLDTILKMTSTFIALADAIRPVLPLLTALLAFRTVGILKGVGKGFSRELLGKSSGGMVPGSGGGDTVPAMLTRGEFVMSAPSVRRHGVAKLASMNAGRGYAQGGPVLKMANGGHVGKVAALSRMSPMQHSNLINRAMIKFGLTLGESTLLMQQHTHVMREINAQGKVTKIKLFDLSKSATAASRATRRATRPSGVPSTPGGGAYTTTGPISSHRTYAPLPILGQRPAYSSRVSPGVSSGGPQFGPRNAGRFERLTSGAYSDKLFMAALVGGPLLSQIGGKTGAGLSGAVTGGLIGNMLLGSRFGPAGLAVGAALGASGGIEQERATQSNKEAFDALARSTKNLQEAFDAFMKTGVFDRLSQALKDNEIAVRKQIENMQFQATSGFFGMKRPGFDIAAGLSGFRGKEADIEKLGRGRYVEKKGPLDSK